MTHDILSRIPGELLAPTRNDIAQAQADGPDTQAIPLHGTSPKRNYTVTNVRTGEVLGTFSGANLANSGLRVALENPYSAAVLAIEPAKI